jgi:hypothetical protein
MLGVRLMLGLVQVTDAASKQYRGATADVTEEKDDLNCLQQQQL